MNFLIILVRPFDLHFDCSTFSGLSATLSSNIFLFHLIIFIVACKNHYSHEIEKALT